MKHPVEVAVAPLKDDAIARAEQEARKLVERVRADLAAAGGDLQVAAPFPYRDYSSRSEYQAKASRHDLFVSLTEADLSFPPNHRMTGPKMRVMCDERISVFIASAMRMAASQYDAFVIKLVMKIGACDVAALEGNHVWSHSILSVRKGDVVERWKTQQIVNVSKLGTLFNQWPTRKLKG